MSPAHQGVADARPGVAGIDADGVDDRRPPARPEPLRRGEGPGRSERRRSSTPSASIPATPGRASATPRCHNR